jgi:hypothetical protein
MAKSIRICKSFEEQEMYFLEYYAHLSSSERLQAPVKIQKKKTVQADQKPAKK